jgi:integrase
MMKRKSRVKLPSRNIMHGKQYPGVRGKVVDWVDHAFEDDVLYLHVRFTDKTELCWRIGTSLAMEEADLSDWKAGNFKQLAIFAERESDPGVLGVGWHTFRHTVGTMLAEMGEHQITIRDYLRHSNLHVINKYLQATPERKRLAHGKLVDAILPGGLLSVNKSALIQ